MSRSRERSEKLNEVLFPFQLDLGVVLDLDFDSRQRPVSIQGHGQRQVLCIDSKPVPLPDGWGSPDFPLVRSLRGPDRDELILVVDTCPRGDSAGSAWVLESDGTPIRRFNPGPGVFDIVAFENGFAAAYHPEAAQAYGFKDPVAVPGLAFFDRYGRPLYHFNQIMADLGAEIENVICCLCKASEHEILFVPQSLRHADGETRFPVVRFDWQNLKVQWWQSHFEDPIALTVSRDAVYLFSPVNCDDEIIGARFDNLTADIVGTYPAIFRGLPEGRFLAQLNDADYSVVDMRPAAEELKKHARRPARLTLVNCGI